MFLQSCISFTGPGENYFGNPPLPLNSGAYCVRDVRRERDEEEERGEREREREREREGERERERERETQLWLRSKREVRSLSKMEN